MVIDLFINFLAFKHTKVFIIRLARAIWNAFAELLLAISFVFVNSWKNKVIIVHFLSYAGQVSSMLTSRAHELGAR